jgi:hypothetical protein
VTKVGVGTNRYAYSGGDPVNRLDPGGNGFIKELIKSLFGGSGLNRTAREAGEHALAAGMKKLRDEAVSAAWRKEKALVLAGGGT